ncbi:beta-ketoacyl synthase N-terminal-like domain-containing protein [Kitasatospora sp. NPDC059463]|uniref:beta-ketoacyl synthase N-terminal-like domain-containing protein n=1 Tax=unclassified Kitasatospora TaxID=2633591 RepID=UPI0036762AAC
MVGAGLVVPGAASPAELWDLFQSPRPLFTEPGDRYRNRYFWDPDPGADDSTYTRVSGFIDNAAPGFRPAPPIAAELAAGRYGASQLSLLWLRHSLAQALTGTSRRPEDRYGMYLGIGEVGCQDVEETLLVEAVVGGIEDGIEGCTAARKGSGAARRSCRADRLRSLLRSHYRHAAECPGRLLPDRLAEDVAEGLLPRLDEFLAVDAACASGLYAVDLGVKGILDGGVSVACCGAVASVSPQLNVAFAKLGALSPDGRVRALDPAAAGTVLSDGAFMVVLKEYERARSDGDCVLGVVGGFGGSSDGAGRAAYAPSTGGQRLCLRRAWSAAGVEPAQVPWVLAHGTATLVGDETETAVLRDLAPAGGFLCSANKSLLGHSTYASGGVSLILALLALEHASIPAQPWYSGPSAASADERLRVPVIAVPYPGDGDGPRTAAVSAMGFGGINGHLVVHDRPLARKGPGDAVCRAEPLVVAGWTAVLPGSPDDEEVERGLVRGRLPAAPAFPRPHSMPTFAEARLPAYVLRATDPGQWLELRTAARFSEKYGPLWEPVGERTGVYSAQTMPCQLHLDTAVRCYARDLDALLAGEDQEVREAFRTWLAKVRARAPVSNSHSLTGLQGSIGAARITNRYHLQGPAMNISAARGGGERALLAAARALSSGELDLALVVGLNAHSAPVFASLAGVPPRRLAEGAFLVALAREPVAREQGWPVLGGLTADVAPEAVPAAGGPPLLRDRRTYLGGDGVLAAIRAVSTGGTGLVGDSGRLGVPALRVTTVPARTRGLAACAGGLR